MRLARIIPIAIALAMVCPALPAPVELKDLPWAGYSFQPAVSADEDLVFTPPGFDRAGVPATAKGETARLKIRVVHGRSKRPVPCRINVVGPDGNFYEPADNPLKIHSLTGQWPKWPKAWGNRPGKAPIRYFGRFFYSSGEATVVVPAGGVRIEVWKGFEYRPATRTVKLKSGEHREISLSLQRAVNLPGMEYWSGDPHIHIERGNTADEKKIFDLMEAEDIHFGAILAYNEPAGPYAGFMKEMDTPQFRGLGPKSVLTRRGQSIVSGQEYRSSTYGHLNLFQLDGLVFPKQKHNANDWPPFGHVGRMAQEAGGFAFYAHGGYAKEIYADFVQGNVDGVELLQFGVYRGIGLINWYHLLNCGFAFPIIGASDYPACRKLGDCRTYVRIRSDARNPAARLPSTQEWFEGARAGNSFVTTGPMILLDVDGHAPGERIEQQRESLQVRAQVKVFGEVAPVSHVQIIVNGRIAQTLDVPVEKQRSTWIELDQEILLDRSAWIAARAWSLSATGSPDAEAHTNPVYVHLNQRAPFEHESVNAMIAAIDRQIDYHRKRKFERREDIISYFQKSRDELLNIRAARGRGASEPE